MSRAHGSQVSFVRGLQSHVVGNIALYIVERCSPLVELSLLRVGTQPSGEKQFNPVVRSSF